MNRSGLSSAPSLVLPLLWILSAGAWADTPQLPAPASPSPNPSGSTPGLLNQDFFLGNFWGERSKLEDEGFSFKPIYSAETFGNPIGGTKQGVIYEGLLDLELNLDFKKMAGWSGAFHSSFYYPMGNSLTDQDTNDLFRVSNIDAYDTPHLFELWYEQKVWQDKIAVRVGQLTADSEFAISTSGQDFLNSTFGWMAPLATDSPSPQFPYASPGVRLSVAPDEHWSFLSGVYAGDPAPDRIGDPNPNRTPDSRFDNSGTDFAIDGSDGLFVINELTYKLNQGDKAKGLPGTYKVGGWMHTGTFSDLRYDDHGVPLASPASDGHPRAVDGNHGFYVVADQAVWQDNSDPNQPQNVSLFFRGGTGMGDRSTFDYYCDGGIVFNGWIPGRPDDVFGLATAYGSIGSGTAGAVEDQNSYNGTNLPIPDYEQNIELTYFAQVAKWWTVQPDFQVILHPGGSAAVPNAVVLGVRTVITF
jgi:porin